MNDSKTLRNIIILIIVAIAGFAAYKVATTPTDMMPAEQTGMETPVEEPKAPEVTPPPAPAAEAPAAPEAAAPAPEAPATEAPPAPEATPEAPQ